MLFIGHRVWGYITLFLGAASLSFVVGCGDPGPDRVSITPEERTLEVGDSFQFRATVWAKNKELSGLSFEWEVEGDAGTVDSTGRFTAREQGEAVIIARTGDIAGRGKVVVKAKPDVKEVSEKEVKTPSIKPDYFDLQAVILLDGKDFKEQRRKPVTFSHLKHADEYGVACLECHHDYQNGKNVWNPGDPVKRCVDCHDPEETQDGVMRLQEAFHTNCRDCHKEMVDQGKAAESAAPYRRCTDCHGN